MGELTISEEKCRVARYRLVEELHSLKEILSLGIGVNAVDEFFCSEIEIVGSEVRSGALVDRSLFLWRKFRLKLVGDFFGNFALDGEDISQVAVLFFSPDMCVIAGIN